MSWEVDNIEATGISKIRDPYLESDGIKIIRQKLRERMNPKMGKIDIDYEVLYDAFFKDGHKPKLTGFGEVYFEGREDEQKMRTFKPGRISEELRTALGIGETAPPPWIINMQRYGPPPAYPNLKIPGLNTQMPEVTQSTFSKQKGATGGYGQLMAMQISEENLIEKLFLWGEVEQSSEFLAEKAKLKTEAASQLTKKVSQAAKNERKPNTILEKISSEVRNFNYNVTDKPLYEVLEQVPGEGANGNSSYTYKINSTA